MAARNKLTVDIRFITGKTPPRDFNLHGCSFQFWRQGTTVLVRWSPRALAGGLEFALTRMNAGRNLNGDLRPSWAVRIFWEVTFGIESSLADDLPSARRASPCVLET